MSLILPRGAPINWEPTTVEEVEQNVRTLLVTETGSVPLARALGTPQDVVDLPQPTAAAKLTAAVIKAVRTYEPRVAVKRGTMTATTDGAVRVAVEIVEPGSDT